MTASWKARTAVAAWLGEWQQGAIAKTLRIPVGWDMHFLFLIFMWFCICSLYEEIFLWGRSISNSYFWLPVSLLARIIEISQTVGPASQSRACSTSSAFISVWGKHPQKCQGHYLQLVVFLSGTPPSDVSDLEGRLWLGAAGSSSWLRGHPFFLLLWKC